MAELSTKRSDSPTDFPADQVPRVLLVDDDPDILRIVQFYLKKRNYHVLTASSGEEALNVLREHAEVELVLSDVMMPGISGLELLQEIRGNPRFSDLSVVLISAEGQTAKKVAGLNLGADDYITKPSNVTSSSSEASPIKSNRLNTIRLMVSCIDMPSVSRSNSATLAILHCSSAARANPT